MPTKLITGQNAKLSGSRLSLTLEASAIQGGSLDASVVLLTEAGKVSSDQDFIFFNQPRHPSGALVMKSGSVFQADLSRVPTSIHRLAFVLTVEGGLAALKNGYSFTVTQDQGEAFSFDGKGSGRQEKSLIVCELYRRDESWKVKVVDQGFAGGMAPLAEHFGVVVDDRSSQTVPPAAAPEPEKRINLSKITLEKKGDTISLEKKSSSFGQIRVNLNWNQGSGSKKRGILGALTGGGSDGRIDLDLGCMFELKNGQKGVIQALGKRFGSLSEPPYIKLDGDDRTGSANSGENLQINGKFWSEVERIMVFAFIYEGVPNWSQTDGVVRIMSPDQPEIEIRMDAGGSNQGFCVIAMLENHNDALHISKEVNYFSGHAKADEQYNFGFSWKAGSK